LQAGQQMPMGGRANPGLPPPPPPTRNWSSIIVLTVEGVCHSKWNAYVFREISITGQIRIEHVVFFFAPRTPHAVRAGMCRMNTDREDVSFMVTAGATANTTEGNSRASRESGLLCSHAHKQRNKALTLAHAQTIHYTSN